MKDEKGRGKGVVMKVIKRKIIVCNLFFAIAFQLQMTFLNYKNQLQTTNFLLIMKRKRKKEKKKKGNEKRKRKKEDDKDEK